MKQMAALAGLMAGGLVLAFGAMLWRIVDQVGESRVYTDLTRWGLMITLIVGGIVGMRVLLTGLARLSVGRNAHKAQPVERQTVIREKVIDGRAPAPQILAWNQPNDLRQIYPDVMRTAIERATPAQLEAPEAQAVELPAMDDVWSQVEALFVNDD